MLRQRVITATILLAVILVTLYRAPTWAWGLFSIAALWAAGREWQRLIDGPVPGPATPASSPAAIPAPTPAAIPAATPASAVPKRPATWLATGLVALALAYLGWRETSQLSAAPAWMAGLLGLDIVLWLLLAVPAVFRARLFPAGAHGFAALSLFCLWLGLYELRRIDPTLLLSAMALIWAADVGAYFVGRAYGRRKLAPRVSPGKSWEGALGGLALTLVLALAAVYLLPETPAYAGVFPRWLAERAGLAVMLVVAVALVALSIIGDLFESLLKRSRGVKDSGRLFPGHGGVLDRIDALVPTMPLALFVVQVVAPRAA